MNRFETAIRTVLGTGVLCALVMGADAATARPLVPQSYTCTPAGCMNSCWEQGFQGGVCRYAGAYCECYNDRD